MADADIFTTRADIFYGVKVIGRLEKPNLWNLALNTRFSQTKLSQVPRKIVSQTLPTGSVASPDTYCSGGTMVEV